MMIEATAMISAEPVDMMAINSYDIKSFFFAIDDPANKLECLAWATIFIIQPSLILKRQVGAYPS